MARRITSGLIGSRAFPAAFAMAAIVLLFNVMQTASAQPCNTTPPVTDPASGRIEGLVVLTSQGNWVQNPSVATDFEGKFLVSYETERITLGSDVFVQRFNADGTCFCDVNDDCPTQLNDTAQPLEEHLHPSVSMNWADDEFGSKFHVAFLIVPVQGNKNPPDNNVRRWIFDFETPNFVSPAIVNVANQPDDFVPSSGISAGLGPKRLDIMVLASRGRVHADWRVL